MIQQSMEDQPATHQHTAPAGHLGELLRLFLKLGTIAFGGPAAHIAMMEDEVVGRRKWLSREQFLDMLGATNLIPGPNSTEMAIHIGYQRAGLRGLLVAGASFIFPAVLMVCAIAWAYVKFGRLPQVAGILYGVKPIVIAIVVQALWRLDKIALKGPLLIAVGIAAAAANALGANELLVLFAAAFLVAIVRGIERGKSARSLPLLFLPAPAIGTAAASAPVSLLPMFLIFLKIGSVLFGSGYVLLAFLRADLVERLHWLTPAQLLDATAVGQVTPGPVFTTATFIGWVLAGPKGALLATVGIFLPAFFFVAVSAPFLPRLRKSPTAGAFLDGLNAASLALMAVVTWQLGRSAIIDLPTTILAALGAAVLLRFRLNATWLVGAGAAVGLILTSFHR